MPLESPTIEQERGVKLCPKTKLMLNCVRTDTPQRNALHILIENVYREPTNKVGAQNRRKGVGIGSLN